NPDDVRARHGIEAFPAEAKGSRWWWATEEAYAVRWRPERRGGPERPRWQRALARLGRLLFRRAPRELAHWVQTLSALRGTDVLVVAGTGIVADYMCGPLKWPYDMFKLALLARLRRTRVAFLSVGVGPIRHPLSRFFIKSSLGLAQYR